MIEIYGKYNKALCYTPELEKAAEGQIKAVCDREEFADCKIRIMPDVHAGLGCTIGTTMTITDKVVPGMVGVDIGCGMETVRIAEKEIDFEKLDALIRSEIPSGMDIREEPHPFIDEIDLEKLRCAKFVKLERARKSIGTLGGGNHFIEIDKSENGDLFIVVHSGSRHIGNEVAKYYQEEGYKALCGNADFQIAETIERLKEEGRFSEIQKAVEKLKAQKQTINSIPKDLAYVSGGLFDDYIHDMKIIQKFAMLNRKAMTEVIINGMGLTETERFTTVHNYIDTDSMILRKGSVSARLGEKLLIPINMRDGSLVCIGKGNPDWNFSAPHGAGRLMSRSEAFKSLSLDDYKKEMEGIFTTCVGNATLDEAPMAYKNIDEIIEQIEPTAKIIERIKPVYNFKATE
ncbi:MAG: RtcB family protein [Oscillospiraceae bacterium]|nr:RtcB family protein [Oscillospiraceae bacterium]